MICSTLRPSTLLVNLKPMRGCCTAAAQRWKRRIVRARRGVLLISASRAMPPAIGAPMTQLAVEDFEKVREIREREQTLARRSLHQRGELFMSLADGWNRLGDRDKARSYFERITRDLKGSVYEQRAQAWLDDKPETKNPQFFACSGCHVD